MGLTDRQSWARVVPGPPGSGPGLPTAGTCVLERNPDAMNPESQAGHVWLGTPGKVLHVDVRVLEFTHVPPTD